MPKVQTRTYVDPEIKKRFVAQFPQPGAISWLLETAMLELIQITDGQPPLQEVVRSAIRRSVLVERLTTESPNAGDAESPIVTDSI